MQMIKSVITLILFIVLLEVQGRYSLDLISAGKFILWFLVIIMFILLINITRKGA